jgi:hypothetical protein
MESEIVSKQVLKDYILEYQISQDPDKFKQILARVDNLVLSTVHHCIKKCPHLELEDPEAIYQTALVGLYKAVVKVPSWEDPDHVIARLVAYMRQEIRSNFPYRVLPEQYFNSQNQCVPEETVYEDLDYEMILELLGKLVEEEIITRLELDLITTRYRDGIPCSVLASSHDLSEATIRSKINDGLIRIRSQLRSWGVLEK